MLAFADRKAASRLVALERRVSQATSAAMIAYHQPTQQRLTTSSTLPPWLRAAQRVAQSLLSVLPTVLMTNSKALGHNVAPFSRVEHVDLLKLSRLGDHVPPRALCGLKMTALLHGWQHGVLPERVLQLDHDLVVVRPAALLQMLEPLAYYDFAGVMEGMSRGWSVPGVACTARACCTSS
jgi:hypothetical protein